MNNERLIPKNGTFIQKLVETEEMHNVNEFLDDFDLCPEPSVKERYPNKYLTLSKSRIVIQNEWYLQNYVLGSTNPWTGQYECQNTQLKDCYLKVCREIAKKQTTLGILK